MSSGFDKKLIGLCWIHGVASLHKTYFRIHKGRAHPELVTHKANTRDGRVTICPPRHPSPAALVTPGC